MKIRELALLQERIRLRSLDVLAVALNEQECRYESIVSEGLGKDLRSLTDLLYGISTGMA